MISGRQTHANRFYRLLHELAGREGGRAAYATAPVLTAGHGAVSASSTRMANCAPTVAPGCACRHPTRSLPQAGPHCGTELADLELEEERLETAIKLAIGAAKGIAGVATWQTVDGRRRFNPEWLKADDPKLYEEYLSYIPRFQSAKFKADDPEKYAAHQEVRRIRSFHLMEDSGTM